MVIEGEPWFVAADVCRIMGIKSVDVAIRKLPSEHKDAYRIRTPGGSQLMIVVSEPGLYRLFLRSNKPNAEPLMKFVTEEVLPTIRKTGGVYMTAKKAEEILADPDLIIGLAQQVKALKVERDMEAAEKARIATERDEAVRTKAHISEKREITAMTTASKAVRENNRNKAYVEKSKKKDRLRQEYRAFPNRRPRTCVHCGFIIDRDTVAHGIRTGEKMPLINIVHARCLEKHLDVRVTPRQYADNCDF